jgi:diaminopimelate decarboxylase
MRGIQAGQQPPVILCASDVFRDNALFTSRSQGGCFAKHWFARYDCPTGGRWLQGRGIHPGQTLGFGHGHVNSCDTGGPSSKHGVWFEDLAATAKQVEAAGMHVVMLHAHIGSGPRFEELHENLERLADEFAALLPLFPKLEGISLGGGIPTTTVRRRPRFRWILSRAVCGLPCKTRGGGGRRPLRVEIEPRSLFCRLVLRVGDASTPT